MKPAFRTVALIVIATMLGLFVGSILRRNTASISAADESAPVRGIDTRPGKTNSTVDEKEQFARTPRMDDSPLATALAGDLSMSEGVTRWLYWLEAVEKAQLSDFPRLAKLAEGDSIALDLLAARWIDLNPRHLFDTLVSQPQSGSAWAKLGNTLFDEWPKRDLASTISALSDTNRTLRVGAFQHWRREVARKLIETDAEAGLKLFSDWSIENFGPRMKGVAVWAAKDPRHAAEFARAHPAGHATDMVMEEIGKQWAEIDPREAMNFAAAGRDPQTSILAASALKHWTEKDLQGAAEWLVSADASTRNRLSPPFVEAWGKKDAEGALSWSEANLTGSTLAQAVGSLVKGAAENDVRAAAELVNSLRPSAARTEGAVAVAQKWMPEYSSHESVTPDATAWMAQLDSQSLRRALEEVQWRWSENDPRGFADFLAQLKPEQVPDRSYAHIGRILARTNPEQALKWASELPDAAGFTAGQEAFGTWYENQPANALNWLDSLNSADARRDRYFETMVRYIAYDFRGPERLATLPEKYQEAARGIIEKMPLSAEHRAKFQAAVAE